MRIVGLLVVCLSVMVGVGANLAAILNLPSLIIVLGGTLGMLLFSRCQVSTK
jgi:flagellar motor component MotA